MSEMFFCACCHTTFMKERPEKEVEKEAAFLFPGHQEEDICVVCEDCFVQIMGFNEPLQQRYKDWVNADRQNLDQMERIWVLKEEAKIMFPDKERVTIDLTEWNEYIADDVPPGPIPCGVELETMSICTADSFKRDPKDGTPSFLQPKNKTVKQRLFWRIKK